MSRNFFALKNFLDQHFVGIDLVEGGTYPAPLLSRIIAAATSGAWMVGVVLVVFGDTVFATLGIPEPNLYQVLKRNKIVTVLVLLYVNAYGQKLLATGAFEVILNDEVLFSRLETGEFPPLEYIVSELQKRGILYIEPSRM